MSKLSVLFHAIKDKGIGSADASQAITDAVADVRIYTGAPIADLAADRVESLELALEAAIRAYLVAKLGPMFGGLAGTMATTAVHTVLGGIEATLRGAAAANDAKGL